jgi:hypothetical protein
MLKRCDIGDDHHLMHMPLALCCLVLVAAAVSFRCQVSTCVRSCKGIRSMLLSVFCGMCKAFSQHVQMHVLFGLPARLPASAELQANVSALQVYEPLFFSKADVDGALRDAHALQQDDQVQGYLAKADKCKARYEEEADKFAKLADPGQKAKQAARKKLEKAQADEAQWRGKARQVLEADLPQVPLPALGMLHENGAAKPQRSLYACFSQPAVLVLSWVVFACFGWCLHQAVPGTGKLVQVALRHHPIWMWSFARFRWHIAMFEALCRLRLQV